MVASVWGMVKVSKATDCGQSYTLNWWLWLFFTGTMLACTISVKFVGLFVVILAGLHTVNQLWIILGDLDKPIVSFNNSSSIHLYSIQSIRNQNIIISVGNR